MKDIIKSIKISDIAWSDDLFNVRFVLHENAGQKFFEEVHHAVECELLPGADTDLLCTIPNPYQACTFFVNGVLFALFDGEMVVDTTRGWYSLWLKEQHFNIIWDSETNEWYIDAEFPKIKGGDDKFDYTDFTGLPEDFWVEPAKLIRDIFSSK